MGLSSSSSSSTTITSSSTISSSSILLQGLTSDEQATLKLLETAQDGLYQHCLLHFKSYGIALHVRFVSGCRGHCGWASAFA